MPEGQAKRGKRNNPDAVHRTRQHACEQKARSYWSVPTSEHGIDRGRGFILKAHRRGAGSRPDEQSSWFEHPVASNKGNILIQIAIYYYIIS